MARPKHNLLLAFARVPADQGDLFRRYSAIMNDRAWNRSLTALYQTRSYEAGLQGSRTLIALTERFKDKLGPHGYERNLIRIALLQLTCLDRLDWLPDYLDTWNAWWSRSLPLSYKLSRRGDARIRPFILDETNQSIVVHFLYVTRARKELIETKLGRSFRRHARHEDLSDDELRERLAGVRA